MSGVIAGLIASVKAGSEPAPTNIITNGSFTVNTNGWTDLGTQVRETAVYRSAPASYGTGFSEDNGAIAEYTQAGALTVGSRYSLSLWIRNSVGAQPFGISMTLGTSTTFFNSASYPQSTSWQYIKFENQLCVGNSNFSFYIYGSNGNSFEIDDVSLVLGATALP
jgi:hypothetical protein